MKGNKEYNMAVALLQFKVAYKNLVLASKDMPDLDLSENYPFYLLDFEAIENTVVGWCSTHATRLMRGLPDKVDNPACLDCDYYRSGIGPTGACRGGDCANYPFVLFTREVVTPTLIAKGYSLVDLDDTSVQLLYMKVCEAAADCKN